MRDTVNLETKAGHAGVYPLYVRCPEGERLEVAAYGWNLAPQARSIGRNFQ